MVRAPPASIGRSATSLMRFPLDQHVAVRQQLAADGVQDEGVLEQDIRHRLLHAGAALMEAIPSDSVFRHLNSPLTKFLLDAERAV